MDGSDRENEAWPSRTIATRNEYAKSINRVLGFDFELLSTCVYAIFHASPPFGTSVASAIPASIGSSPYNLLGTNAEDPFGEAASS
jgi:hypothetical protein